MEKILIKPDAKEIVFRGKPEDGHVDAFSYNYEGSSSSGLGSLFIVGQVQPATEDTSYMVNLIASLAKREYYAKPDAAPKDSFSKTLKKINEVLQDFFRNKETKVNIGIFAIAGDNILISRLGKFKIILGRDNQNIDILNNVNLFNKEHIQEKEFSNIISGRIIPQDKIFAFYPGRSIVAREKNIKADLLKSGADDFAANLDQIRKTNPNFLCAGIHISINKHLEPAFTEPPQPRELKQDKPKVVLAKMSRLAKEKPAEVAKEMPGVRNPELDKAVEAITTQPKIEPAPQPKVEVKPESTEDLNKTNVYYPGNKSLEEMVPKSPIEPEESPLIRPSEFSSAKKENFLSVMLRKYKPSGIYIIGQQPLISKKRMITISTVVILVIAGSILAKLTFFPSLPVPGIESQQDKDRAAFLGRLQTDLETAQLYKDQNNLLEARKTLLNSISAVAESNLEDEDLQKAKTELVALLDSIDKAVESSPSLLYEISQEIGKGTILSYAEKKLLVYATNGQPDSGSLLATSESGIENTTKVSNFNPVYLFGSQQLVVMLSKLSDQIGSMTLKDGGLKTSSLALSSPVISAYPYQSNLYILTGDSIYKIADAIEGKNTPVKWLTESTLLPPQPIAMAVDSKIFVITQGGSLATYYKGEKQSEVSTSIPVSSDSVLLTYPESSFLYLVDKKTGRIYVIDRNSGTVDRTIKIDSDQPLVSASMSETGTLYLLTSDNKVWKITP